MTHSHSIDIANYRAQLNPSSHHHGDNDDPLQACPASALSILLTHPDAALKVADLKIHSFKFDEVPVCWRRLYTDASILLALDAIETLLDHDGNVDDTAVRGTGCSTWINGHKHVVKEEEMNGHGKAGSTTFDSSRESTIQQTVRWLDMALIIAGAPHRTDLIAALFADLQAFEDGQTIVEMPARKRRKMTTSRVDAPAFFSGTGPDERNDDAAPLRYPIARMYRPSLSQWVAHVRDSNSPVILTSAMEHWPALHSHDNDKEEEDRAWRSPMYLLKRTFNGRRLVPVELGRTYTSAGWGQRIMPIGEFVQRFILSRRDDDNEDELGVAYLAQHDLLAQIPALRADIAIPEYCYVPTKQQNFIQEDDDEEDKEVLLNAWLGPAGTVSPLHTDPHDNLFAQVVGRKYIRLYSPMETRRMYPHKHEVRGDKNEDHNDGTGEGSFGEGVNMSNTSRVDAEQPDLQRFPLFSEARYVETRLQAGEMLYVPKGWWHYVRAETASWSVSFWW